MMRESLEAGATYAYMLASAGKGTAFQRRQYTNGSATGTSGAGTAGYYLKVTRSGNIFDAYESADGASWSWVGGEWVDMPPTIYVGVAVTSHHYGVSTTAMFSDTDVNEWSPTLPSSSLPSEWFNGDVGAVARERVGCGKRRRIPRRRFRDRHLEHGRQFPIRLSIAQWRWVDHGARRVARLGRRVDEGRRDDARVTEPEQPTCDDDGDCGQRSRVSASALARRRLLSYRGSHCARSLVT